MGIDLSGDEFGRNKVVGLIYGRLKEVVADEVAAVGVPRTVDFSGDGDEEELVHFGGREQCPLHVGV